MSQTEATFPAGDMTDPQGRLTPQWRAFFLALFSRTGGTGKPVDLTELTTLIAAQGKEVAALVPLPPRMPDAGRMIAEAVMPRLTPPVNQSDGMVYMPPGAYQTAAAATASNSARAKVAAVNTSGQSIASATTYAAVTGWTTVYDANSNFNASTGVFTAPATGDYWFSFQLSYLSVTGGASVRAAAGVYVGSTNMLSQRISVLTTSAVEPHTSGLIHLTAGQTVTFQASQNGGAATTLGTTSPQVSLSIVQLP